LELLAKRLVLTDKQDAFFHVGSVQQTTRHGFPPSLKLWQTKRPGKLAAPLANFPHRRPLLPSKPAFFKMNYPQVAVVKHVMRLGFSTELAGLDEQRPFQRFFNGIRPGIFME